MEKVTPRSSWPRSVVVGVGWLCFPQSASVTKYPLYVGSRVVERIRKRDGTPSTESANCGDWDISGRMICRMWALDASESVPLG